MSHVDHRVPPAEETRLGSFLERVRKALSHDLRSPLGTISNYAAILEFQGDAKPDEIRSFAHRIRSSSVRAANQLGHAADALALVIREPRLESTDVGALLRKVLEEHMLLARFPARTSAHHAPVVLDAALVTFAWRAFLALMREGSAGTMLDVDLDGDGDALELFVGARDAQRGFTLDVASFVDLTPEASPDSCFALALAEDLVALRGGKLSLSGNARGSAGLALELSHDSKARNGGC
ncbi:MAG: hypothetical protein ACKVWV_02460 [Planctomycetota bacterium]